MVVQNNDTPMEFFSNSLVQKSAETSKSAVMPGSTPASRMAGVLFEEKQLARSQMADELRVFVMARAPLIKAELLAYINLLEKEA